ncbi:MAG: FHA domain-containing protein [Lachnospiraceae bacterium]|nr:FHA domain-containing protein [Lachnospiraceae bacterium]
MEFNYETQNHQTNLIVTLDEEAEMDSVALGMIVNQQIPGFVSAKYSQQDNQKWIRYDVTSYVPLREFFRNGVNRTMMLRVLDGIVSAILSAEDYMIEADTILVNEDYTYVNAKDYQVALLCIPQLELGLKTELKFQLRQILSGKYYNPMENHAYVNALLFYLNQPGVLRIDDLKEKLNEIIANPESVSFDWGAVSGTQTVQSDWQTNWQQPPYVGQPQSYVQMPYEHHSGTQSSIPNPYVGEQPIPPSTFPNGVPVGEYPPNGYGGVPQHQNPSYVEQPGVWGADGRILKTGFPVGNEAYGPRNTSNEPVVRNIPYSDRQTTDIENISYQEVNAPETTDLSSMQSEQHSKKKEKSEKEKRGLLDGLFKDKPKKEKVKPIKQSEAGRPGSDVTKEKKKENRFSIPGQDDHRLEEQAKKDGLPVLDNKKVVQIEGDFGQTVDVSALSYDEVMMVGASRSKKPYLIRVGSQTKTLLPMNGNECKIGRDSVYADYSIPDVDSISRRHAVIRRRGNEYFIIDTNSKHHVYVNGQMIQVNQEICLHSGTKIRLANVEFEFLLEE